MQTVRYLLVGALLCAGAVLACHRGPEVAMSGSGPNVITSAELDSAGTISVYDVILRRHALFFKTRGATSVYNRSTPRAVVFLGETPYGEIETLRNQPASRFEMIRYYTGIEAASKFGSQYHGGVIQLIPRVE